MFKKIALITVLAIAPISAYDQEIKPKCEWLYDLSQSRLTLIDKLTDYADRNIGVSAKDAYSLAEEVQIEFNFVANAFTKCQNGEPYTLTTSDLTTEDEVNHLIKGGE